MKHDTVFDAYGINRAYRTAGGTVWALRDVGFTASAGQITALSGPSGSGKSTMLRLAAAIDRPDQGTILIGGVVITGLSTRARRKYRRRKLGYVFQDPGANLLSYMTVQEHMEMAARLRGVPQDPAILGHLELTEVADEIPAHLSSGQQQRVALATAVTGPPEVLLADEPTAELDDESARLAISTLVDLRDRGATLLVTSHDAAVLEVADRVIRLEHGAVVE